MKQETYQQQIDNYPWLGKLLLGTEDRTNAVIDGVSLEVEEALQRHKKENPLIIGDVPLADTVNVTPVGLDARADKDAVNRLASAVIQSYKTKLPLGARGIVVDKDFRPIYSTVGDREYLDKGALGVKRIPKSKLDVENLVKEAKKRARYMIYIRPAQLHFSE